MPSTTRKILADNLARLMHHDARHPISQAALKRKSGVDQSYIGRILKQQVSATADVIEKLAKAFDLDAWQLLVPDLDPSNPPVNHMTESERRLYDRLRDAARMVMEDNNAPYRK